MDVRQVLEKYHSAGNFSEKIFAMLQSFYRDYINAAKKQMDDTTQVQETFKTFLSLIIAQTQEPYPFAHYHQRVLEPFNYHSFGLEFIRPLINFKASRLIGEEQLDQIEQQLMAGDNVIFLANHQTEPDPQIINLLLEKKYPKLSKEMIFVAGHRVRTDPLCIPFSLGINLLCIYSKRYLEVPPEKKREKIIHNHQTMQIMSHLLAEGGKCIYVAPSGGRDRPNEQGRVEVASFDAQSIEMFWLMSQRSGKPTHFYPLTLGTYDLMPPPEVVHMELGERRIANYNPVYFACGDEVDMNHFPGSEGLHAKEKRTKRAEYIHNMVVKNYEAFQFYEC